LIEKYFGGSTKIKAQQRVCAHRDEIQIFYVNCSNHYSHQM